MKNNPLSSALAKKKKQSAMGDAILVNGVSRSPSPERGMNKNVKLALWFNLLETASASVRAGDALSAYLWLVTKSNRAVGWLQGAVGVAQLAAALPAGWAADHPRCRRDTVLKVAAGLGAVSAVAFGAALIFNRSSVAELFVAVALLGAWKGAATPPFESIFADSVATGASGPYTAKYALSMVAAAAGPLLSCFLFMAMGDEWDAGSCRTVLLAGLAAMLPPLAVACAFDDDASLGRRSEARDSASMTPAASVSAGPSRLGGGGGGGGTSNSDSGRRRRRQQQLQQQRRRRRRRRTNSADDSSSDDEGDDGGENGNSNSERRRMIAAGSPMFSSAAAATAAAAAPSPFPGVVASPSSVPSSPFALDNNNDNASSSSLLLAATQQQLQLQLDQQPPFRLLSPSTWPLGAVVASLITLSDLIGALASGMTLKFFSLFFLQACDLGPVAVSLVGTAAPLGVAAASMAAGALARRHGGRLHLSLLTRAIDVGLLVLLAHLPTNKGVGTGGGGGNESGSGSAGSASRNKGNKMTAAATAAVLVVHLLRMASANATRPLVRAMLMENVPKRHRGKVNALDSVRTFSWSGSAALGGELIARYGFGATFVVTAGVKVAAMLPLVPLIFLLPEEGRVRIGRWTFGGGGGGGGNGAGDASSVEAASGSTDDDDDDDDDGDDDSDENDNENGDVNRETKRRLPPLPPPPPPPPSSSRARSAGNNRRRGGTTTNARPGSGGFGRRGAPEGAPEQRLLASSTDEEAPAPPPPPPAASAPSPLRRGSSEHQRQQQQQQQQHNQNNSSNQQRHHQRPPRNDSSFSSLRL